MLQLELLCYEDVSLIMQVYTRRKSAYSRKKKNGALGKNLGFYLLIKFCICILPYFLF